MKLARIQKEDKKKKIETKVKPKTSQNESIENSDAEEVEVFFCYLPLSTQSCSYLTLCPIRRRDTVAGDALRRIHFLRPQFDYCSSMIGAAVRKTAYCCCCFLLPSSTSWKTDDGGRRP